MSNELQWDYPHAAGPPRLEPDYWDGHGDGRLEPAEAFRMLAFDLEAIGRRRQVWRIESAGGRRVRFSPDAENPARVKFDSDGVAGFVEITLDPSGWTRISAGIGGAIVFVGYLDWPWEDYEILPAGARVRRPSDAIDSDPPGRIGKRRDRLSLDVRRWPTLAPLASRFGYFEAAAGDE